MSIAVLTSGGVDSSLALALLKMQGHRDVQAYYLKIWLEDDLAFMGECPWEEDLRYVRSVCERLDVPLEIVPLQSEYQERVVEYVLLELRAGRTPSPDIFCNQRIKFGAFVDLMGGGHEFIASGHYAQVEHRDDVSVLKRAIDPVKDQTYFLSHLSQVQLRRCLFPIGGMPKSEVRALATQLELPTMSRPDSQGICFLGKIKYSDFIRFHLGQKRGKIVDIVTGKILGEHLGYWFHTIGQRKGLGLSGGPWFVVGKELRDNIVFVAHEAFAQTWRRSQFELASPNWLGPEPEEGNYRFKVRHGARLLDGKLLRSAEGRFSVELCQPDQGLAPGQFCVVYADETCLGAGMIAMSAEFDRHPELFQANAGMQ